MFIKLVNYALFLWLPFYLSEGLGLDRSLSSLMANRFDLGFICGAILAGLLSDVTTHWARMPMRRTGENRRTRGEQELDMLISVFMCSFKQL